MQYLRAQDWVKATVLPDSPTVLANLLKKGWIERQDAPSGTAYRITEAGLTAKRLPMRIRG
jgi:hypothetical protein